MTPAEQFRAIILDAIDGHDFDEFDSAEDAALTIELAMAEAGLMIVRSGEPLEETPNLLAIKKA
jgi:hypothetical protein